MTVTKPQAQMLATLATEGEYPYRTDAIARLHPDGWAHIPPSAQRLTDLTPTQHAVTIERLLHIASGGEPETGDPHPHVIAHQGHLYVHDGHHRYVTALLRGAETIWCRVVDESGRSIT